MIHTIARAIVAASLAAGALVAGAGVAGAQEARTSQVQAEDGARVSSAYYSDPVPVTEYERRLTRPGACKIARDTLAKWKPGQPLPPASVATTITTCLADAR